MKIVAISRVFEKGFLVKRLVTEDRGEIEEKMKKDRKLWSVATCFPIYIGIPKDFVKKNRESFALGENKINFLFCICECG